MQLVSFKLSNETYGIEITKIREIILVGQITRVPETPHYIKGLINLRSSVIPVIDLRARFSLAENELSQDSRIMVLNVGRRTIGIVVDSVNEVLRVSQDQISPAPPTVASLGNQYMTGLVRLEDQLLILLDVDRLFGEEATAAMDAALAGLDVNKWSVPQSMERRRRPPAGLPSRSRMSAKEKNMSQEDRPHRRRFRAEAQQASHADRSVAAGTTAAPGRIGRHHRPATPASRGQETVEP